MSDMTVHVCTCPLIDVSVQPHEPEFVLGSPRGCPTHGRDLDAKFAAAEAKARAVPRTFALPTIPEDVQAVRDADDMIWYRHRHGPGWWNEDGDRLPTAQLLAAGKVTEILPGEFEAPEVLEDNRG